MQILKYMKRRKATLQVEVCGCPLGRCGLEVDRGIKKEKQFVFQDPLEHQCRSHYFETKTLGLLSSWSV